MDSFPDYSKITPFRIVKKQSCQICVQNVVTSEPNAAYLLPHYVRTHVVTEKSNWTIFLGHQNGTDESYNTCFALMYVENFKSVQKTGFLNRLVILSIGLLKCVNIYIRSSETAGWERWSDFMAFWATRFNVLPPLFMGFLKHIGFCKVLDTINELKMKNRMLFD